MMTLQRQSSDYPQFPHLEKETALLRQGYRFIAGLDEAGRGAWAGPVVAALVVLPLHRADLSQTLAGLRDSKLLTPDRRQHFFDLINKIAVTVSVGMAPAQKVDELNVVGATRCAMEQAIHALATFPDYLLLDHITLPDIAILQDSFPRADNISLTVAAASVIAKVTRDRIMVDMSRTFPAYAFDSHKGYGTQAHRLALDAHGPTPLHRMSFAPLRAWAATSETGD